MKRYAASVSTFVAGSDPTGFRTDSARTITGMGPKNSYNSNGGNADRSAAPLASAGG